MCICTTLVLLGFFCKGAFEFGIAMAGQRYGLYETGFDLLGLTPLSFSLGVGVLFSFVALQVLIDFTE